ncbi:MAG TPA: precorrin-3B synthase [Methylocella sp.]|nr:precorrin-3B synthase [Methylocella sp.]
MNALPLDPTVKGWCPSAFKPMETGDGFLVRLNLSGGEVTSEQGHAIASLAKTFGNGLIDLTQRGNLQLRGVSETSFSDLIEALRSCLLLDGDKAIEPAKNIIGSPLAGVDLSAKGDGKALLRSLEASIASASDLAELPAKFCFLVDDGGLLDLDAVAADIRLIAGEAGVTVAIAVSHDGSTPIITSDAPRAIDAAIALARAFLKLGKSASAKRMNELAQTIGIAGIAHAAGLPLFAEMASRPSRATQAHDVIGLHKGFIGVAPPFGRLSAEQMQRLADATPNDLRLTPWRSVLLPGGTRDVLTALEGAGLITSPGDARLAVIACSGRPACSAAQIDTHSIAETLAVLACQWTANGIAMHISGCHKGCAHSVSSPITLVGGQGAIDVVFDGRADDMPHLTGLDLAQVKKALRKACGERLSP